MPICLLSPSLQKAATESESETGLFVDSAHRTGLGVWKGSKANSVRKDCCLGGLMFMLWLAAVSHDILVASCSCLWCLYVAVAHLSCFLPGKSFARSSCVHSGFHVVTCLSYPSAQHTITRHLINISAALKRANSCDKALLLVSQAAPVRLAQK